MIHCVKYYLQAVKSNHLIATSLTPIATALSSIATTTTTLSEA